VLGWKEYELELMRDRHDNVVVVCSIENVDPMGVHTGDSVTVAPAMTLTDREYQRMRDLGIAVLRAVGVDTGGCNVQFAVDPADGRLIVIEMNPRVSRSSALASKATGFPIAKIAAKLAIGYTLDEITNDITGQTPASFEPTLDYVVVKVPRFAFEKFPGADRTLTTTMKSVGEAMAIGRSFPEALLKALRSLDTRDAEPSWAGEPGDRDTLLRRAAVAADGRIGTVLEALRAGVTVPELSRTTGIDPWFLDQLGLIDRMAARVARADRLTAPLLFAAKRLGFSDAQVSGIRGLPEQDVRRIRHALGVRPVFKTVDTCAAEFAARTPYHYSTYDEETEVAPRITPAVLILGSGPNRIGQGIEFDYSCVHASFALRAAGYQAVMVNCNPETVSTDYDTSDRLYFEPLTVEHVLEVVDAERAAGPVVGVIVQFGGQTPLGLARALGEAGVPLLGTSPEAIHLAEDRGAFGRLLHRARLPAPRHGTAFSFAQAKAVAEQIGYPVLVRPSYVLGGRGMEIVYEEPALLDYITRATEISPEHPVLVDRFLDDAIEIDVDALHDGQHLFLGGVMEHIEHAGVHSGDSACVLPPVTLGPAHLRRLRDSTQAIAAAIGVRGLINIQFALSGGVLYVLEANPRASRTVPFVSKATGVPLARAAVRIALGDTIAALRREGMLPPTGDGATPAPGAPIAVKEAVLPWSRFRGPEGAALDMALGPEMRSTGEVMGIDATFGAAFAKSQAAAGEPLPTKGRVLVSVADRDKRAVAVPMRALADLGFEIVATGGTAEVLRRAGVAVLAVPTGGRGGEPPAEQIATGRVDLVVSTAHGSAGDPERLSPERLSLRAAAAAQGVPCLTTVQALSAAVRGIEVLSRTLVGLRSLQEYAGAAGRVGTAPVRSPPAGTCRLPA
jgi:carbamoyl-phosphate synthase large subunit